MGVDTLKDRPWIVSICHWRLSYEALSNWFPRFGLASSNWSSIFLVFFFFFKVHDFFQTRGRDDNKSNDNDGDDKGSGGGGFCEGSLTPAVVGAKWTCPSTSEEHQVLAKAIDPFDSSVVRLHRHHHWKHHQIHLQTQRSPYTNVTFHIQIPTHRAFGFNQFELPLRAPKKNPSSSSFVLHFASFIPSSTFQSSCFRSISFDLLLTMHIGTSTARDTSDTDTARDNRPVSDSSSS